MSESIRFSTEEIIKMYKRAEELGGWKKYGVPSKIAREFKVSRPTLYKMLKLTKYKSPIREPKVIQVIPKYEQEFEKTEFMDILRTTSKYLIVNPKTGEKRLKSHAQRIRLTALRGWRIFEDKDPISWNEEDFKTLWDHGIYRDVETGKIRASTASDLLIIMKLIGRYDILQKYEGATKGLKREPKKRHWYLSEEEIFEVANKIETPDFLIMFLLGVTTGARYDALKTLRTERIHYDSQIIEVYESKISKWVEKLTPIAMLDFLRQYIRDFNITGKLFLSSYTVYKDRFIKAGIGTGKKTTLHIMKHTFVTLASLHGVGLDTISIVVETNAATLMKYYFGAGLEKQRADILGEALKRKPWHLYVKEDLIPHFRERYNQIKGGYVRADGIVKKEKAKPKKPKKAKKKRPFNWASYRARIAKYDSLSKKEKVEADKSWGRTISSARKALALHNKGYSDTKVRKMMGWT